MNAGPRTSRLLARLPRDYAIVRAREVHAQLLAEGKDPINLSIGEPDIAPPPSLLEALADAARRPGQDRYPRFDGAPEMRAAFADFYERRYGRRLDAEHEVVPLIGGKEGLVHLAAALCDRDLPAVLPPVGYPVYESAARMADAPILRQGGAWEDGYAPRLPEDRPAGGLVVLASPANPTGSTVDDDALDALLADAGATEATVCFDAAYVELPGSGPRWPPPVARGRIDGVVELHSLSKTVCLPGWRVAFMVGDRRVLAALKRVKSFVDAGVPTPLQRAVAVGLAEAHAHVDEVGRVFLERQRRMRAALRGTGLDVFPSDAGMFCWTRAQGVAGDALLSALQEEGVVAVAGASFGPAGVDCVRMSVSIEEKRLDELARRAARAVARAKGEG